MSPNPAMWDGSYQKQQRDEGDRKTRSRTMKRNLGLKQKSPKQEQRDKTWAFIRRCFLLCQMRTDGFYSCQECGLRTDDPVHLDLDHIERRLPNNYTPGNAMLLCNRFSVNGEGSCHSRKTGVPWPDRNAS